MAHVNPIQIQKFLKGVDYPASKANLIEKAKSLGADENVQASLEQLPDEEFQTPADVSQAFGRLPDDDQDAGAGREQQQKPQQKAQQKQPAEPKTAPRHTGENEFLVEAMQDTLAEIRICEMALEKSQNHDVKVFAQKMIDEHGRMRRDMERLAEQKKLTVPQEIRREQKMTVDELNSLAGRDFEQRWIQYNIDVHERDTKVFRHYASEEHDEDIREMAKHGAETLGKHLKMAHDVGKKLAKA
jgi:predicted outer membrane protein